MDDIAIFLEETTSSKIHSSEIAKQLELKELNVKQYLQEMVKTEEGMEFDYSTGWLYIPGNYVDYQYQIQISLGRRMILAGLLLVFLFPPVGILVAFAGVYIILKAWYRGQTEDGKKIDLVGAGAIMNSMIF